LRNGKLRWSSPTLFNDLAEFQRMPRFEPSLSDSYGFLPQVLIDAALGTAALDTTRLGKPMQVLLAMVQMLLSTGTEKSKILELLAHEDCDADSKVDQRLREHFEGLRLSQARVLCLTPKFDNEVMWGTYADNHCGYVLGFTHIPDLSTPLTEARQIAYSDQPPVVGSGLDFLLYGDTPELRRRTMDAVCFSKKLSWSYEQEWRVLTWRPEESDSAFGDYKFYPKELESVTFGARATPQSIEGIVDIIGERYPHVVTYRMESDRGNLKRVQVA
jgi:hypothetical protein